MLFPNIRPREPSPQKQSLCAQGCPDHVGAYHWTGQALYRGEHHSQCSESGREFDIQYKGCLSLCYGVKPCMLHCKDSITLFLKVFYPSENKNSAGLCRLYYHVGSGKPVSLYKHKRPTPVAWNQIEYPAPDVGPMRKGLSCALLPSKFTRFIRKQSNNPPYSGESLNQIYEHNRNSQRRGTRLFQFLSN